MVARGFKTHHSTCKCLVKYYWLEVWRWRQAPVVTVPSKASLGETGQRRYNRQLLTHGGLTAALTVRRPSSGEALDPATGSRCWVPRRPEFTPLLLPPSSESPCNSKESDIQMLIKSPQSESPNGHSPYGPGHSPLLELSPLLPVMSPSALSIFLPQANSWREPGP